MRWFTVIILALHLAVGLYLLNLSFNFYSVPELVTGFNDVIILAGGVLVLLGGLNFLRTIRPRIK